MPDDRFLHPRCGHSEKVTKLTDFEYRVWTQYILSADDFGVMRASAVTLQEANDALEAKKPKVVQNALEHVIAAGLLRTFTHQGRRYVFQHDWQAWQKVEWPRTTLHPMPDADSLAKCEPSTQLLFAKHPGGVNRRKPKHAQSELGTESRAVPKQEQSLAGAQTRETANAKATANGSGSEGGAGETAPAPMDVWFSEFFELYPAQSRVRNNLTEVAFFDVLCADARVSAQAAYAALCARLEGQKRSHQWRIKGMIPRLDRYLREGLHLQELPEDPPVAEQLAPRTNRTLAAAVAIMREGQR